MVRRFKPSKNYSKGVNGSLVGLLAQPPKPLTLLGVSLKSLVSESEWRSIRSNVWRRADQHCEVCGEYVRCDKVSWGLHLYESVKVDYKRQEFQIDGVYALCSSCFGYLHPFTVESPRGLDAITKRGDALLAQYGYHKPVEFDRRTVYYLSYKGFRYINDFYGSVALRALERGLRVIHYEKVDMVLPFDAYYRKPMD